MCNRLRLLIHIFRCQAFTLIEQDRRKIEEIGRPAGSVLRVHQHLQRKPIITTKRRLSNSRSWVSCGAVHSQAREKVTQSYTATLVARPWPSAKSIWYYRKRPKGSRANLQNGKQTVAACGEKPAYRYRRVAWWPRRTETLPVNRKRVMREPGLPVRSRRLRARFVSNSQLFSETRTSRCRQTRALALRTPYRNLDISSYSPSRLHPTWPIRSAEFRYKTDTLFLAGEGSPCQPPPVGWLGA